MRTAILCTAGFLIGISVASFTQKPVMESLGYWPEEEIVAKAPSQQPEYANTSFEREGFVGTKTIESSFDEVAVFPNAAESEEAPVSGMRAIVKVPPRKEEAQSNSDETATSGAREGSAATLPLRITNTFVKEDTKVEQEENVAATAAETSQVANSSHAPETAKPAARQRIETETDTEVASTEEIASTEKVASTEPNQNVAETPAKEAEADIASEVPAATTKDSVADSPAERVVVAKPAIKSVEEAVAQADVAKQSTDVVQADKETADPEASKTTSVTEGESRTGKELLTGQWKVVKATHRGREIPAKLAATMSVVFEGEQILFKAGSRTERGSLVLEASDEQSSQYSPMRIDSPSGKKPAIKGVYSFEGETLTMIWGAPGAEQPNPESSDDLGKARVLKLQQHKGE